MNVRVWDYPTRLFHWLLAASYAGAFVTTVAERLIEYHVAFGYAAGALTVFRVIWGFAGNRNARFAGFVRGWGAVRDFIAAAARSKLPRFLGHNPAVGWMVLLLLLMTAAIAVTGAVTYGGEEKAGLFAGVVDVRTAVLVGAIHGLLADAAIALVVMHILAALFHDFVLRENIILAMVTGVKEDDGSWSERVGHLGPERGHPAARMAAWMAAAVLIGAAFIFLPPEEKHVFTGSELFMLTGERGKAVELRPDPVWREECASSCHLAFHPSLLPARSWRRLMAGLDDHFGEKLDLDEATRRGILDYLVSGSAELSPTEASVKILMSISSKEAPVAVTGTGYWINKHEDIKDEVYRRPSIASKSNCVACHPGAEAGSFEDRDIKVPD